MEECAGNSASAHAGAEFVYCASRSPLIDIRKPRPILAPINPRPTLDYTKSSELNYRTGSTLTFRPTRPLSEARVAVVHEWLYTYAGAEKVLEAILSLFPQADLFSLINFLPPGQRDFIGNRKVHTSFLQKMPMVRKKHQYYLPLMPLAMERFDFSSYDIVISSSYAVSKGALTGPDQLHLCYCHSPVRYAWDLQHQYLNQWRMNKGIRGLIATGILHRVRIWDHVTSNGVDRFFANSQFISRRIWKTYHRRSTVIYPPVDVQKFTPSSTRGEDYVTVSRLVGYKRVDILVEAFRNMPDRNLVVVGGGEDLERLRSMAPPNVKLLGRAEDGVLLETLRNAKAFLFAAEEDFGISLVEAQACGVPVIAFGKGGALESIRGDWLGQSSQRRPTGIFFPRQDPASVVEAIRFFEARQDHFRSEACVENARRFAPQVFLRKFNDQAEFSWQSFQQSERDFNSAWRDE